MSRLRLERFTSRGLQPIDLQLEAGCCMTLTGPSGCGKSLLLRAIADLDPHDGDAVAGEARQSQTPPPHWGRRVGLLPADSAWWADTVGEHLAAWDEALLGALGFEPACLDWEVARLSSGEKQRLAIARMLSIRPQVLLLDEPSANLDQRNTERLEALIAGYLSQHQASAVWVSHDRAQWQRVADRCFQIEQGRLEELPCS